MHNKAYFAKKLAKILQKRSPNTNAVGKKEQINLIILDTVNLSRAKKTQVFKMREKQKNSSGATLKLYWNVFGD